MQRLFCVAMCQNQTSSSITTEGGGNGYQIAISPAGYRVRQILRFIGVINSSLFVSLFFFQACFEEKQDGCLKSLCLHPGKERVREREKHLCCFLSRERTHLSYTPQKKSPPTSLVITESTSMSRGRDETNQLGAMSPAPLQNQKFSYVTPIQMDWNCGLTIRIITKNRSEGGARHCGGCSIS